MKSLAIDLYCGLGGWAEGFLREGYRVIGFDVERHDYGTGGYPGQLVLQDVLTLDGSQFRDAAIIVASPPCQAYSYRAMPWSRAKALPAPNNTLFNACFRIQCEASEAAGHYIPLIVENVKGAQKWGDVPALMPITVNKRDGYGHTRHLTNQRESDGVKQGGSGPAWFDKALDERRREAGLELKDTDGYERTNGHRFGWKIPKTGSKATARKAASAQIAKIPLPLAQWIARCFKP